MNKTGLGKRGEEEAAAALEDAGMEIIDRNIRSKYGEVDIVAIDGNTVVFVEVKAWSAFGIEDLRYSIDVRKQQKIIKTAKYFLSENRKYSNMAIRFDVVFVKNNKVSGEYQASAGCQISHLASAFTESV
jgi:putative endonuclease